VLALTAACARQTAVAQDDSGSSEDGPAVTIYSSADPAGFDPQQFIAQQRQGYNTHLAWQVPGFGVVKEVRSFDVTKGKNALSVTDVAEFVDPTTVTFTDLTGAGTAVLDQSFLFDLVSPSKLLERYVDREITFVEGEGDARVQVTGRVLSVNQGTVVLSTDQGLRFVPATSPGVRLPKLPEGLISKPTLAWNVASDVAGTRKVRTTYQTRGLTWRADYHLVLAPDEQSADVSAWVTLLNVSGVGWKNAKLKLIAGDVQTVQSGPERSVLMDRGADRDGEAGFEEKSFYEYHLYTLPRKTDVLGNTTQQITLFPQAKGAKVEKVYVYVGLPDARHWISYGSPQREPSLGSESDWKIDVYLRFRNAKDNQLGMPLPKGKVRVYKRDSDETLEFVGEDLIDHTPKDETVLVRTGQAFDVVGQRTRVDFKVETGRKTITETVEVEIRNHKDTEVTVLVKETLFRWSSWEITEKTDEFEKVDANTVHFPLKVAPNASKKLRYTVRYTW
jgi:hypothetical protein